MQGRQSKGNDPWDRSSSEPRAAVNGTGKPRSIPQRPRGMPHIDQPPATQRVARPRRDRRPPQSLRRRILVRGAIVLVCAIVAFVIAYGAVQLYSTANQAAPAASTAGDFLSDISAPSGSTPDYDAAYNDLAPSIRIELTKDQFKQQALCDDTHYGHVTKFTVVAGSATTTDTTASYTYTITRSKLSQPYSLHLTFQKGADNSGNWVITNYTTSPGNSNNNSVSNTLGPPGDTQCS